MPRLSVALTAVALVLTWGAEPRGQAPTTQDTGSISGRVIDGSSGAPLSGAMVSLVNPADKPNQNTAPRTVDRQITDRAGRFTFTGLPASRPHQLLASKPGYFEGAFGIDARHVTPQRVVLAAGQAVRDAAITLWKPSAIAGMVLDEAGEALVGVYVTAVMQILVAGMPQFASGPVTRTDDRGVYRLAPLTPGTYAVMVPSIQFTVSAEIPSAPAVGRPVTASSLEEAFEAFRESAIGRRPGPTPRLSPGQHVIQQDDGTLLVLGPGSLLPPPPRTDGRRQSYPSYFYPAARAPAGAALIALGPGEERAGIDVQLTPVPVSRLSGVLEGPPNFIANRRLRLLAPGNEHLGTGHETANAFTDSAGRFSFVDVPDGTYVIEGGAAGFTHSPPGALITPAQHTLASLTGGPVVGPIGSSASAVAIVPGWWPARGMPNIRIASDGPSGQVTRTPVEVAGADRDDLVVTLETPVSVTVRILIDTPEDRTALGIRTSSLEVMAEPAGARPTSVGSRGSVPLAAPVLDVTLNLRPGDYVLRMYGNSGRIKSLTWGGRDYTGVPITIGERDTSGLVIVVTSRAARIEGSIREAPGARSRGATVIYFPTDASHWRRFGRQPERLRSVPMTSGRYGIADLPAGEYYVVAVEEGLADRWKDPAFLEAAARVATRVTVGWGDTRTQDLTVTEVRR